MPPTSVSQDDPGFSVRDTGYLHQLRYWRGPTWINTAWLCWIGLRRLGYNRPAAELARRLAATILRSGLREYYNPYTGSRHGRGRLRLVDADSRDDLSGRGAQSGAVRPAAGWSNRER